MTEPRSLHRRRVLAAAAAGLAWGESARAAASPAREAGAEKVLRYAFPAAETSFDPSQISDLYSRTVTAHIFESPCTYDPLARPARIRPLTAAEMPSHSDDFRDWTVRIRPGIFFADDPAFGGRRRELVAQDYVYAIQRFADPALKCPLWSYVETFGFVGLKEKRQRAMDRHQPFDYDAPVEGLRASDRHTLQIRLREPRPRFTEFLAETDLFGAVAREVVEHYGERISEHPVGTGPFVLRQWRRGSLIVLGRNPDYRERRYDAEPAQGDAEGQALLARFKGRRLPMVDRVELSIIEESQPRWLAFLNGEHDLIEALPPEYAPLALPNGRLAPHLARRGVQGFRQLRPDAYSTFFNLDDAVVGGYTADKVALRRAIGLGLDVQREIELVHHGQGLQAQSPVVPHTTAYDPAFRSEMGTHDPARAQALLDLYGYRDRNGDGWREAPDGSPMELVWSIETDQRARHIAEQYQHDMTRIGVKIRFKPRKWPELLRAAQAGQYQVWHVGLQSSTPDSLGQFQPYDSRQKGGQNLARFRRPEVDALYRQLEALPDGPERQALFFQAKRQAVVWMPYKIRFHRISSDLAQPQLIGYRHPLFWVDWWMWVDVVGPA